MRRCVAGGAGADSYDEFEVWDFALHHAIVVASRNPLLVAMYHEVERARKGALWGNLKRRNDSRGRRAAYQADHERLVDCAERPRASARDGGDGRAPGAGRGEPARWRWQWQWVVASMRKVDAGRRTGA